MVPWGWRAWFPGRCTAAFVVNASVQSPRLLITKDLVRRLEQMVVARIIARLEATGPVGRFEVRRFRDATAIKVRWGWPCSAVFGFGEEEIRWLPDILEFFEDSEKPPEFHATIINCQPNVIQPLRQAGFYLYDMSRAILAGSPDVPSEPIRPGVALEDANEQNLEDFVRTMASGAEWDPQWRQSAMDALRRRLEMPGVSGVLGRVDGVPAGTGLLTVHRGFGILEEGGVLPRYQGRGCHLALLDRRFQMARNAGCRFMMGITSAHSINFRNLQRFDMHIAYHEAVFSKPARPPKDEPEAVHGTGRAFFPQRRESLLT